MNCDVLDPPLQPGKRVRFRLSIDEVNGAAETTVRLHHLGEPLKLLQMQYRFVGLGVVEVTRIDDVTKLIHAATFRQETELDLLKKFTAAKRAKGRRIRSSHAARRAGAGGGGGGPPDDDDGGQGDDPRAY
jgi:hypothetical protein